jgi:aspartyl-tRNA synthetase
MQRTNYCGLINEQYLDQSVSIFGWVHRRRDLGGVIFLDIRDKEGIVQAIIEPNTEFFKIAEEIKHEYVILVEGIVKKRFSPNLDLKNGNIEIVATKIEILNTSKPIPILIDDSTTSENNRMLHRIIDLRGHKMQNNLRLRHKVTSIIRRFLDNNEFIDIETPFLTKTTPGGAKDFLVASSVNRGYFYALPQSPQIFKQLLMVSGFDRYYQIVKCFRDEALRADRQPEFTQIDIETSFLDEFEIRNIIESLFKSVCKEVLNIEFDKLAVITYNEAMSLYGSDKPDLRIPLKFIDLTYELKNSSFKVFNQVNEYKKGKIISLKLPDNVNLSRKEIDNYTDYIKTFGASGMAYIKINDINQLNENGLQSPIVKFLTQEELASIINKTEAKNGETILFVVNSEKVAYASMGALRLKLGHDKKLYTCQWAPLWVVDFPLFEYDEEKKVYTACHHPFTSPKDEHIDLLITQPESCYAKAYDLVLNGSELGGGSVRIYRADIQSKIFEAMGISDIEAQDKFGFLLENLQYGAPPHGGFAFGLDRWVSLLVGADSIRDVIAFPKTTTGQCLLTNAPSQVSQEQLQDIGVKLIKD